MNNIFRFLFLSMNNSHRWQWSILVEHLSTTVDVDEPSVDWQKLAASAAHEPVVKLNFHQDEDVSCGDEDAVANEDNIAFYSTSKKQQQELDKQNLGESFV